MTTKLMGQGVPRVEDQRFLRGQGRFLDDIGVEPASGCCTPRCCARPHAHARILDIDVDGVLDVEGVHLCGPTTTSPARPPRGWPSRCPC